MSADHRVRPPQRVLDYGRKPPQDPPQGNLSTGCFGAFAISAFLLPRLGLSLLWLLSALGGHPWGYAVHGNATLLPFIVLFIMPFTTWIYTWTQLDSPGISSSKLLAIVVAAGLDLFLYLLLAKGLKWSIGSFYTRG